MRNSQAPPAAERALDLSGLLCPLVALEASKELTAMAPGQVLEVVATDPASRIDLPAMCDERGHRLIAQRHRSPNWHFWIERRAADE